MDTWEFQENEDGSSVGWNDAALQTFKIGQINNLAREIIQNSLDHPADPNEPVRVVFELIEYPRAEVPGIDSLAEAIEDCRKNMATQSENSRIEINTAYRNAKQKNIPVLTISDYGTAGMAGTFKTYIKTSGQSDGTNSDRGGSHGLGKSAPIVLSKLRTIIVSSVWKDKKTQKLSEAIQGRTTLMARKIDGSEKTFNNIGYWGGDAFSSIESAEHSYPWINRQSGSVGTSIHVIGFGPPSFDTWEKELIGFAVATYYPAFLRGHLILNIKNKDKTRTIDKNSLDDYFQNNSASIFSKKEDQLLLEHAKQYFQLLESPDETIISEEFEVEKLGKCRLRLRVADDDELCKKICVLRKNMKITDSLSTFYKRQNKSLLGFVGVFECMTDYGERYIRRMEPPQHNDINEEQLPTDEMSEGRKILKDLGEILKELVNKHAKLTDNSDGQIDFLSEFLQDEEEDGKESLETDPNGKWNVPSPKPLPKPPKPPKFDPGDEEEGTSHVRPGPPKPEPVPPKPTPGPGPAPGPAPSSSNADAPIQLSQLRVVRTSDQSVKLFFLSKKTQNNCELKLLEMGSDSEETIGIVASDTGTCRDGIVSLDIQANQRIELCVDLERPLLGTLRIIVAAREVSVGEATS
jgi:hypothetical protein